MIIGIHPDRIGQESYSEKWAEYLRKRGVEVRVLNLLTQDALDQARKCDGIMWRWTHTPQDKQSAQRILYTIEHYLHIPVFPSSQTAWHYDEKVAQFYLLQALSVPVVPHTWLFWDRKQALDWAKSATYPVIWKLSSGAGSSNVLKINDKDAAFRLINRAFVKGIFPYSMNEFSPQKGIPLSRKQTRAFIRRLKYALFYIWRIEYPPLHPVWWKPEHSYAYFQEYLPANEYDTRVTVIGNRAFTFRRMNRPNDFRASGSGNFCVNPELIDKKCIEIAFEVSEQGNFQSMAYDFLYKEKQPVICEISYTFADYAVHQCPGHWDTNLNWNEGHMWPQEAQVENFLNTI